MPNSLFQKVIILPSAEQPLRRISIGRRYFKIIFFWKIKFWNEQRTGQNWNERETSYQFESNSNAVYSGARAKKKVVKKQKKFSKLID